METLAEHDGRGVQLRWEGDLFREPFGSVQLARIRDVQVHDHLLPARYSNWVLECRRTPAPVTRGVQPKRVIPGSEEGGVVSTRVYRHKTALAGPVRAR